ncbi:ATP-dependent RNA helicase RhlB, partial [Pseudoxanthomonas beigongshangi]
HPERAEGERGPRKRRRRRHGRPVENADAGIAASTSAPAAGKPAANAPVAGKHDKPSFFSRLGRKLKSLVGG